MRNALPQTPWKKECAIINLDDLTGNGTHWVAYVKNNDNVNYFDSFGNLRPPIELLEYLGVGSVQYNYDKYQGYGTYICGHLCLKFLTKTLYKDTNDPHIISLH